jgi:uncharacterized Zn finger protein
MNLSDFEEYIDDTILSRGLSYYKSGSVISLEYDGNEWLAKVEGSEKYTVTARIDDEGEIFDSDCDCPYDWGEYCKHQSAVFYALRNQKQSGKGPEKSEPKESLENILRRLDNQTLLSVVLEIANKDRRIKEELLMRFSEKHNIAKYARGVIKSAIRDVLHRGYVEYRDTRRAVIGADAVLAMIEDKLASGDGFSAGARHRRTDETITKMCAVSSSIT